MNKCKPLLSGRAAEIAHRTEVERMDAFRRAMATEAQNSQVTHKSRQEIALEEELNRDLKVGWCRFTLSNPS